MIREKGKMQREVEVQPITRSGMSALAPVYTRSRPTNLFLSFYE